MLEVPQGFTWSEKRFSEQLVSVRLSGRDSALSPLFQIPGVVYLPWLKDQFPPSFKRAIDGRVISR